MSEELIHIGDEQAVDDDPVIEAREMDFFESLPVRGTAVVYETGQAIREKALALVESKKYEGVQITATLVSMTVLETYSLLAKQYGWPESEVFKNTIWFAYICAFVTNAIAKPIAYGKDHLKKTEFTVDVSSTLADVILKFGTGIDIPFKDFRVFRLAKVMRTIGRTSRVANLVGKGRPLEEEGLSQLGETRTWYTMGLLALLSVLGALKSFDASEIDGYLRQSGMIMGIFGLAYWARGQNKQTLNDVYTRKLEKAMAEVEQMGVENPELSTLLKTIRTIVEREESDLNEVSRLAKAFGKTLIGMKQFINPVDEDLELDDEGRIEPKEVDAVVMVTDLRGFTPLTEKIEEQDKFDIFDFEQRAYFPFLKLIIRSFGGKILNHTGDGLIVYFTDKTVKGKVIKEKEKSAMECAKALQDATDFMAKSFTLLGLGDKNDPSTWHRTGVGMTQGKLKIGDAFTMVSEELSTQGDTLAKVSQLIQQKVSEIVGPIFELDPNQEIKAKIASIVGFGRSINEATRLESQNTRFADHDCLIDEALFNSLSRKMRDKYEFLEEVQLKGKAEPVRLFGIPVENAA